ncbi:orotidine-5'-phosphate decarboxylase [Acidobacteriia bacterium AH_259_A11_L15]|nr:orotidine-5'-phosphate decarboxylase [Acidobacteriia bacterium AH_259_A11_L15]
MSGSSAGARRRIIVALDVATRSEARRLVQRLRGRPGFFKVGSQLFTAAGPEFVRELVRRGERVFLDLKFHDIPHIVAEACVQAADLGVSLITVHTSGGPRMLRAARRALDKHSRRSRRPKLLGVTLLTSLGAGEVKKIGFSDGVERNVIRLARLARRNGCDGIIAAPTEVAVVRRVCGQDFLIVTPGIRLAGGRRAADQVRVATAGAALRAGADYIVVGRGIVASRSPARALDALAAEVSTALDSRRA